MGTAMGLVFLWLSMTPSLLPRGPLFQGLISGSSGATGYACGVFSVWLVRYLRSASSSPVAPRWAWMVLTILGAAGMVGMIIWFHLWQNQVRDVMGVPRLQWFDYPLAAVLSLIMLFSFVELGQGFRLAVRWLITQLNKVAPPRVSAVISVALLIGLFIALLNGIVVKVAMSTMNRTFAALNDEMTPNIHPPRTSLRSGGPGSLVSWESLGHQGRRFISSGPSVAELSTFNHSPAREPIRVYAGLHSATTMAHTAQLAAQELARTGGLDRAIVAVGTSTGTGWINDAQASALEYLYNGDTAIVSMQYSFLPSWLSFLVDQQNSKIASQFLFEEVDKLLRQRPVEHRPKLVVFGESLGSFGGETPFMSLDNILARTDGALFSGPTFKNVVWGHLTANRDRGSPQWLPIYHHGDHVRFIAEPADLQRPFGPWDAPRVVYLQHASDPVTWFNPDLLFHCPDWLREPRGRDVLGQVHWIPIVTFLQISADMAVAVDVPNGHGHRYTPDIANAWVAILDPPGWNQTKTDQLRPLLHSDG